MMIESISSFQKWINDGNIQTSNRFFNKIINQFKCLLLQNDDDYKNINHNFNNESKIIIIDKIDDLAGYYVVIFNFTILFISDISKLPNIINNFNESTIFSLFDYHNSPFLINFQEKINIYEKKEMISYFSKYIKIKIEGQNKIEIWNHVKACISSFFINKGYLINRNKRFDTKKAENKEGDFIELKLLGSHSSKVTLAFHVETQEIVSIKTFYKNEKLFNREYKLYSKLSGDLYHPLIPHFYGKHKEGSIESLIIEYIEGKTLDKIQLDKISDEDRFYIIIQIMIIIEYLQFHGFVYRDLKPNNLIVDRNYNIKLIDFDQAVYLMEDAKKDLQVTKDFNSDYASPELTANQENVHNSNKMDVFSIGVLIYFIFFNETPKIGRKDQSNVENYSFDKFSYRYPLIKTICEDCTETEPENRPSITKLIDFFFNYFYIFNSSDKSPIIKNNIKEYMFYPQWIQQEERFKSLFNKKIDPIYHEYIDFLLQKTNEIHLFYEFELGLKYYPEQYFKDNITKFIDCLSIFAKNNYSKSVYYLGEIYYYSRYIERDIKKAIHYLTLAANKNYPNAQDVLGNIYLEGKYIKQDMNKGIHYLILAANQNYPAAQNNLGIIYLEGKYIKRDINKAIHYFTLAANQNESVAQTNLGMIYLEGEYIKRDMNKAIHYFTLAANKNEPSAQNFLGKIYSEGEYIKRDIIKGIHYLTLAANQNYPVAQNNLGMIYWKGEYIKRDMNKAIHYFTLAANQNYSDAQNDLGKIYSEGEYIKRDIIKGIHYFTLAANQNYPVAQTNLGMIYLEGEYIKRDINKAIHYLTLAANQNFPAAQNVLGKIYSKGEYIKRDIIKGIHYLTLAANQNEPIAQNNLGCIYWEGEYIKRDINKAIHYFALAANQNYSNAQYFIGLFYLNGIGLNKDINKACYYLYLAAEKYHIEADFLLGIIYSKGEKIQRDFEKSIHYYKEASSFKHSKAKNNLAMIYAHGIVVEKNEQYGKQFAIELLEESIKLGDRLSMYNLAHFYFYDEIKRVSIETIIDLLIKSSNKITPSIRLLSIVLIKKLQAITYNSIENELKTNKNIESVQIKKLAYDVYNFIEENDLKNPKIYEYLYYQFKDDDYVYDWDDKKVCTKLFFKDKKEKIPKTCKTIDKNFYNGFEITLT